MSAKQVYTKFPTEIRHMNVKFIVPDSDAFMSCTAHVWNVLFMHNAICCSHVGEMLTQDYD